MTPWKCGGVCPLPPSTPSLNSPLIRHMNHMDTMYFSHNTHLNLIVSSQSEPNTWEGMQAKHAHTFPHQNIPNSTMILAQWRMTLMWFPCKWKQSKSFIRTTYQPLMDCRPEQAQNHPTLVWPACATNLVIMWDTWVYLSVCFLAQMLLRFMQVTCA